MLSKPLFPDANTGAIDVTAANVTIDLNGFSILGPNVCARPASGGGLTCTASGSGIGVSAPGAANAVVMNGTVRGMGNAAVSINGVAGNAPNRVEKVAAVSNGSTGIILTNGVVPNGVAALNAIHGLGVGSARVSGDDSTNDFAFGLFIEGGAYDNNTFSGNGFTGSGAAVGGTGVNLGQNLCSSAACSGAQF